MSPESPLNRSRAKRVGRTSAVALGSGAMLVAGSGGLLLATETTAMANPVLNVTNVNDSGAGSLRQAILDANAAAGADVIQFDPGLSGTITLSSSLPALTEAVTVNGLDAVAIDGGWRDGGPSGFSVFQVGSVTGNFAFNDVTITGGNATYGGAIGFVGSSGDITITSSSITGNYSAEGGAIGTYDTYTGSLTVIDTTVSSNRGGNGSAGITVDNVVTSFPVTISNSIFDSNVNTNGEGGALYLDMAETDRATITGSTFTNNISYTEGGVLHLAGGNVTIADSTFTGNTTTGSGGALYLDYGDNVITNSVFSGNSAAYDGGAIHTSSDESLTISGSTFTDNIANTATALYGGGAVHTDRGTSLTIESTTISGNSANKGGAIEFYGDLTHGLTIRNSTISNNTADVNGGGILSVYVGSVTVENSTIAANAATTGSGGAIFGSQGGITLTATTITQNTGAITAGVQLAGPPAPGPTALQARAKHGVVRPSGSVAPPANANLLQLNSTILAGNGTTDIGETVGTTGSVKSDHSMIGTSTVTVTDLGGTQTGVTGAALLLGPLANNGGPTNTFALLAGSPAIDTGMATLPAFTGNDFDQRGTGFARVVNGIADVGAYELQDPKVVPAFTG